MSKSKSTIRKSSDIFCKQHHPAVFVPERFRAGIKALGPDGWAYLAEFLRENKISNTHGTQFGEKFQDHMLTADRKTVICGSAKLAAKLAKLV